MVSTATEKVRRHRQRMRAAGYRPVQYWVPDTRSPEYRARLRRQIAALKGDVAEQEAIEWAQSAAAEIEDWQ